MGSNEMKNLLAIRHVPFEDLGSLAPVLDAAGYRIQYADAPTADFDRIARQPWDLLVVLGGPISSNDTEHFPFLLRELQLIEAQLDKSLPVLGICLGSQLLARVFGARVQPAGQTEIGWHALTLTDTGQGSPLRHLSAPVFHWHGETFDIPDGAIRLAGSELCANQAFSVGTRTLALQFHPEVTAAGLEQWYVGNVRELQKLGLSPAGLREQAQQHAADMTRQASLLLNDWLARLAHSWVL